LTFDTHRCSVFCMVWYLQLTPKKQKRVICVGKNQE
jgi:hypothetical protein